uniref:SH3 domain-containing protein n=1 Tax=Piscirickettsia salmonis TaxID=1238 RepID=UPI0039F724CB
MKLFKRVYVGFCVAVLSASWVWATPSSQIKLYESPNASSKVVESIDQNDPLITIFEKNGWRKVGNPSNGVTGWIKNENQANVKNQTTKTIKTKDGTKTITKGEIQTPQGPMQYEIMQYQGTSVPKRADNKLFDKLKQEQLKMNDIFANSWSDFEKMQKNMMQYMKRQCKAPIFMPSLKWNFCGFVSHFFKING